MLVGALSACVDLDAPLDDPETMGEEVHEIRGGIISGGAGAVELKIGDDATINVCTGVVVHRRALLTAAHCFDRLLGEQLTGTVPMKVNYTKNGTSFLCITSLIPSARCTAFQNLTVRRLSPASDGTNPAKDFAVVVSPVDWVNISDFRGLTVRIPAASTDMSVWGVGLESDTGTVGIMRRAAMTVSSAAAGVIQTRATATVGTCISDSGGPATRTVAVPATAPPQDWVVGLTSAGTGVKCTPSGGIDSFNAMTTGNIDVINAALASAAPGTARCTPVSAGSQFYRCF